MPKRVRAHVNPLSITHEYHFEGFENNNPLIIDVGACKGEFTETLLQKFPEKNFILFEIRVPLAEKLRKKFLNFPNVVVFQGDAGRNFKNIVTPSLDRGIKIEEIFINFPDPWFKEKHKKRRFINPNFLTEITGYIPGDTKFVFQTDQEFLFEETLETLKESDFDQIEFFSEPPYGIKTDWETATTKLGRSIWRMKFHKQQTVKL